MNDTTQLAHALRTLAEAGGEPDEDAAWEAVQTSIAGAGRASRRRRWMALASTAAVGAAAAALVVVATRPSGDQAVDVGPAETPTTETPTTETPTTDSMVGTPVVLPEDPAVVVGGDGSMVNVMDPHSGEHVTTPVSNLPEDERVHDPVITGSGDIYFSVFIPEASILGRTRWDGDGYEVLQFDGPDLREGGGYTHVAADPDGEQLAFSVWGILGPGIDPFGQEPGDWVPGVGVLDLRTNGYRQLTWPEDDPRAVITQPQELTFSPDGSRLAFVNVHDTDGTDLFDVFVLDLTTADSLDDAALVGEALDVAFGPDGRLHGLVHDGFTVLEGGGSTLGGGEGILASVTSITATARHTILARTEEAGWFRHLAGEKWAHTGWDGWHD